MYLFVTVDTYYDINYMDNETLVFGMPENLNYSRNLQELLSLKPTSIVSRLYIIIIYE